MSHIHEIYAHIVAQSTSHQLPGPWSKLPAGAAYVVSPADPAALLTSLRDRYTREQLVEAGVVEAASKKKITLVPSLAQAATLLTQVRREATAPPTQLVVEGSCLTNRWAFLEILQTARLTELKNIAGGVVILTSTPGDAAILESLNMPALYSSGMDRFGGRQLNQFCQLLGVPRYRPQSLEGLLEQAEKAGDTQVVVAAWSVSNLSLDETPVADAIFAHLRRLQRSLGLRFDDFAIWRPTETFLRRLKNCLRYGDQRDVSEALIESLEQEQNAFVSPADRGPKPKTFADAYQEWMARKDSVLAGYDRHEALKKLVRLQQTELIQPLLVEAAAQQSPLARNLWNQLASVSAILNRQALDLLLRSSAMPDANRTNIPEKEFDQWMTLIDQARKLIEEISPKKRSIR